MRQEPCVVRLGRIREKAEETPQTLRQVAFGGGAEALAMLSSAPV